MQALSDNALVERRPNLDDKRSYFLAVTPQGTTALNESKASVRAVEEALERGLGPLKAYRVPLEKLRGAAQVLFAGRAGARR